jgi:tetratricopeptide (TPR) repeat protein
MRRFAAVLLSAVACAHAPQRATPVVDRAAERRRLLELPAAILHKEARELMARGNWEAARVRLEAYLTKVPEHANALFDAGWIAERLGDPKEASDLYTRALASDPAHVVAALNLARLLQDVPARAEAVVRASLQRMPGEPRLLNALAAALRLQHRLDEAESAVHRVLERHPRDSDAYRNLAAIEADRGHLRLAESALNNARKLDPKDPGIPNSLGVLALRRDDVGAARGYFEQANQLDPAFAPAWANLGALALRFRDYAAAEQAYTKAAQLDPARWEISLARGWALEGLRKPREARAEYEKVLAIDPQHDDALYGKALALKAEGDLPGALATFKHYLALPGAAHLKEAQNQLAAIDLRLRSTAQPAAKPVPNAAAAGLDLSKLPQSGDAGPSAEKLPADEPEPVVR